MGKMPHDRPQPVAKGDKAMVHTSSHEVVFDQKQAAEYFRMSPKTLERWANKGAYDEMNDLPSHAGCAATVKARLALQIQTVQDMQDRAVLEKTLIHQHF